MQLPPVVRDVLRDPRLRFASACVAAFCWYVFAVSLEVGRNAAPAAVIGIPAVLVLVWWRVKPVRALGLSFLVLLLVLLTAWIASPQSGFVLAATGWFAMLGGSASQDVRARGLAVALGVTDVLLVLLLVFGYGGASTFFVTAFLAALAIGLGWLWRQVGHRTGLESALLDATERSEAAERDVLLELERNRLAREVHDVVAHSLAVVIAQADGARFAAETKPETVAPALDAIADTARRALGEVRTMLHDLRSSSEGIVPGAEDVDALVGGVRELGVEVEETTWGEPVPLDREAGLALYRIAQEALTNAMRHGSRSEPIGFEVDWGRRQVVLVVTNALAPDAEPATERPGQGVAGMRERAADAGGDCTAGPGANGRYRVRVALPVAAEEAAVEPRAEPVNPLLALFSPEPVRPRAS